MSRTRSGLTLLEVLVGLTITAVVAATAGVALATAADVRDRVAAHRAATETDARLRAWLQQALRHPPEAEVVGEPLLTLERVRGADGAPATTLRFLTRGVTAPLGVGATWRVELSDADGAVTLRAAPLRPDAERPPLRIGLPAGTRLAVAVFEGARGGVAGRWQDTWAGVARRPDAVWIRVVAPGAADPDAPTSPDALVVALAPLGAEAS
jgi:prepilin-type N-terminal cleavage/methylation domain-containing protein